MSFIVYDIIFLCLFVAFTVLFLYKRRSNLQRQGLLYLYRTTVGIKFIEKFTNKYSKILKPLQYVIVACGYFLMATMMWVLVKFSYNYLTSSEAVRALKIPILLPLVPYIPSLFKITFLPQFYFTYWIIIIAIIAIPHEFAHGIFARLNKIKVHSTGFGFLGPFLAAFVEPDDKQMQRAKKFPQLSILASGTFANVLTTIIFCFIIWIFFFLAFSPSGIYFNSYATGIVNVSEIKSINGVNISSPSQIPSMINSSLTQIEFNRSFYFIPSDLLNESINQKIDLAVAFENSPAFLSGLSGAIIELDGQTISSYDNLRASLSSHLPGEVVNIKTNNGTAITEYNLVLGNNSGKSYLGIGLATPQSRGILSLSAVMLYKITDPLKYNLYFTGVNYESNIGDFGLFVYNLLWWIVLVNISVALVNMLPVGIFDGGRFFMLTVEAITGSKRVGEMAFKISTWIILLLIAALMLKWVFVFI